MARVLVLAVSLCLIGLGLAASTANQEEFSEELLLRSLQDGNVLSHFHFTSRLPSVESYGTHHRLFPKAIFQLVRKFRIREMELSFTQGRWNYQSWGAVDSIAQVAAKPVGVELSASFDVPGNEVDVTWGNLTNALSGLFCASLNFLESPTAYMDTWFSLRPEANLTRQQPSGKRIVTAKESRKTGIRYGALPREAVCTENLTPWLKLLPCRDKAGLTQLLDRETIYSGYYHSLRLAVRSGDFENSFGPGTVLEQSLSVVLRDRVGSIGMPNWSLASIFRVELVGSCPLAKVSKVYLGVEGELANQLGQPGENSDLASNIELISPQAAKLVRDGEEVLLEYQVLPETENSPLDVGINLKKPVSWSPARGQFHVSRFLAGSGSARGSIIFLLGRYRAASPCASDGNETEIVIMQMVPWYVRLYGHTLQVLVDGHSVDIWKAIRLMRFTPGEDRKSPAAIEIGLRIPSDAETIAISIEYDKGFLHIDEHPPDANRGFDLPAAIVSFPNCRVHKEYTRGGSPLMDLLQMDRPLKLYTGVLLMQLATPDFSMPYNVITLTCTVLALYFGSMLNVLTRRIGEEKRQLEDKSTKTSENKKKLFKAVLAVLVAIAVKQYLDTS